MQKKKKKKRKIKFGRIFLVFLILFLIIYLISSLVKFPIKNIYVIGNDKLKDQEIIDLAGISDYPSIFKYTTGDIKRKLEKNIYIKKAKVAKKKLKEIYIKIEENYCIFYDIEKNTSVFKDKREMESSLNCPVLVNYVTDTLYEEFLLEMSKLNKDIIDRISEIKYNPNSVDEERFIFTMNDGNYVYLTLMHFNKINNYVEILKNFENKKGILYLDSGEYFKVFE